MVSSIRWSSTRVATRAATNPVTAPISTLRAIVPAKATTASSGVVGA